MALYTYIQKLCRDRGLTIADLERLSGVKYKTISWWDERNPLPETLKKIADVLHVPIEIMEEHLAVPKPKEPVKRKSTFVEYTAKAREMNLSYGKYRAIKDGFLKG